MKLLQPADYGRSVRSIAKRMGAGGSLPRNPATAGARAGDDATTDAGACGGTTVGIAVIVAARSAAEYPVSSQESQAKDGPSLSTSVTLVLHACGRLELEAAESPGSNLNAHVLPSHRKLPPLQFLQLIEELKVSNEIDPSRKVRTRCPHLCLLRLHSLPAATDTKEESMDRQDLPKHILEKVERRWAQKLEQQALAWKDSRSDTRSVTAKGVQVVRRTKRTRRPVLRGAMS
jgi:hypothetical protein